MSQPSNRILQKMLDRLFVSMINGPSLNCRPHNSRQRIDLSALSKLDDLAPDEVLRKLLSDDREVKLVARVPMPPRLASPGWRSRNVGARHASPAADAPETDVPETDKLTPEQRVALSAWEDQQNILTKVRIICDDARTYEQDTGVHVLNLGFPLLSLPPGSFGGQQGQMVRRVLAPLALVPVYASVSQGPARTITLSCKADGVDLVLPNIALIAWLEQMSGAPREELFADEAGEDPWRELSEIVKRVSKLVNAPLPAVFMPPAQAPLDANPPDPQLATRNSQLSSLHLSPAPRADDAGDQPAILLSAVLGLFPASNQGILRDMQAMVEGEDLDGPVRSFITVEPVRRDEHAPAPEPVAPKQSGPRDFSTERFVTLADPFQARAVRLSRESRTLVIHGPPGTGKSQTIANVIGDHLARGQRVLMVCEKRTALDVVANRLDAMGLSKLCGVVHDPQRDQRELYRMLRTQLDELAEAKVNEKAESKLQKVDTELASLHAELTAYHHAVMSAPGAGSGQPVGGVVDPAGRTAGSATPPTDSAMSFHELAGQWFTLVASGTVDVDAKLLAGATLDDLERQHQPLRELFSRADEIGYHTNPWRGAAGVPLADFMKRPVPPMRQAVQDVSAQAQQTDAGHDPAMPPFANDGSITEQAAKRVAFADQLEQLLELADGAMLGRWAALPAQQVDDARKRLAADQALVDAFRSTPLDAELLGRVAAKLPTVQELTDAHSALKKFDDHYQRLASTFASAKQAVPGASEQNILRWLAVDAPRIAMSKEQLWAHEPAVARIRGNPLDPGLLASHQRAPVPPQQINPWIAQLDAYLAIADRWYAFLKPGPRKEAAPVLAHFGLTLTGAAAQQVRAFLVGLRERLTLSDALRRAVPGLQLPDNTDDPTLVGVASEQIALIRFFAEPAAAPTVDVSGVEPALLLPLLAAEAAAVTPVVQRYSLAVNPADVHRLRTFHKALHARLLLSDLYRLFTGETGAGLVEDAILDQSIRAHTLLFEIMAKPGSDPAIAPIGPALKRILADAAQAPALVGALRQSPQRAEAIVRFGQLLQTVALYDPLFIASTDRELRAGRPIAPTFAELAQRFDQLEHVLRIRHTLGQLAPALRNATQSLLTSPTNVEQSFDALRKALLHGEIMRRLDADEQLQAIDAQRLKAGFDRYETLQDQKRNLTRELILAIWTGRQKDRLLHPSGTRLNSLGAELKRRLTLRGQRAMRLRQVVAAGMRQIAEPEEPTESPSQQSGISDLRSPISNPQSQIGNRQSTIGNSLDPLFDLCPVWMASPETVAQVFPRRPIFDIVIFDEASQCRLEEALPTLTRAARVVIAGDPRQLPPTRFFESAMVVGADEEAETDQELFEQQQGEVEDLLEAALGLQVDQAYLDVHYRSRNADLIAFSNEHFYNERLQPIPGHPSKRPKLPPVKLYRANGVYDKRENEAEADQVVELVRELLKRPKPPSIGIACFNLSQRDLIVEQLDDAGVEDADFGKRLDEAYNREGEGSFEGLFVKNLENVQGDERDHIIISTTYGPDTKGRFYRRFGPLGRVGGGRRLNVLVTRAREQIHVVTSIPENEYRSLPPVPDGQSPSGAYLLFAYLNFAHRLEQQYNEPVEPAEQVSVPMDCTVFPAKHPCPLSQAIGAALAKTHGIRTDVHWGNDGFAVDLAIHHPERHETVPLGVLADGTRFAAAEDPVEWDIFRTSIHENQGWKLLRIWSPHFVRDPDGALQGIVKGAGIRK